jgi:S1-C subfamily serine protease
MTVARLALVLLLFASFPAALARGQSQPEPLRYRLERGKSYTYRFRIEGDFGDRKRLTVGSCTYTPVDISKPKEPAEPEQTGGTAFVVHPDGYLITCRHIVENAQKLEVWISNLPLGAERAEGRLVHTFSGTTQAGQVLQLEFDAKTSARYIQIRATKTRSWVAWGEIEIKPAAD